MTEKHLSNLLKDIVDLAQCELDTRHACICKGPSSNQDELKSIDDDRIKLETVCPLVENAWEIRKYFDETIAMLKLFHTPHAESNKCTTCIFISNAERALIKSSPLSEKMAKNIAIFTGPEHE